jgi:hypothetical protein
MTHASRHAVMTCQLLESFAALTFMSCLLRVIRCASRACETIHVPAAAALARLVQRTEQYRLVPVAVVSMNTPWHGTA